jgi:hypothetical protein
MTTSKFLTTVCSVLAVVVVFVLGELRRSSNNRSWPPGCLQGECWWRSKIIACAATTFSAPGSDRIYSVRGRYCYLGDGGGGVVVRGSWWAGETQHQPAMSLSRGTKHMLRYSHNTKITFLVSRYESPRSATAKLERFENCCSGADVEMIVEIEQQEHHKEQQLHAASDCFRSLDIHNVSQSCMQVVAPLSWSYDTAMFWSCYPAPLRLQGLDMSSELSPNKVGLLQLGSTARRNL